MAHVARWILSDEQCVLASSSLDRVRKGEWKAQVGAVEILSRKLVPIPVAKKIFEDNLREELDSLSPLLARTYDYLRRFSKCDPDKAEEAVRAITELNVPEDLAIMFVNILPKTIDEARVIAAYGREAIPTETLEKIVAVLREHCG